MINFNFCKNKDEIFSVANKITDTLKNKIRESDFNAETYVNNELNNNFNITDDIKNNILSDFSTLLESIKNHNISVYGVDDYIIEILTKYFGIEDENSNFGKSLIRKLADLKTDDINKLADNFESDYKYDLIEEDENYAEGYNQGIRYGYIKCLSNVLDILYERQDNF